MGLTGEARRAYMRKYRAANCEKLSAYYSDRRRKKSRDTAFGAFLRENGITQTAAAKMLGVSVSTANCWACLYQRPTAGRTASRPRTMIRSAQCGRSMGVRNDATPRRYHKARRRCHRAGVVRDGRKPVPGPEHRGQACRSRRRAKRPVYGTDQSDKGDEGA